MLKREDVFAFTSACYNGEPASCSYACPFRVDLRSVLKKAARGKLPAAAKELRQSLPFPGIISTLCSHPCEAHCQRCTVAGEAPVSVGLIEKACLAAPQKKERPAFKAPLLPQRIAVVGAGPAGLACALQLDKKRYPVTVFEKSAVRGGHLTSHPEFARFEAEFEAVLGGTDIHFEYNTEISDPAVLADFDAVCLCTGKSGVCFGLAESRDPELGFTENPRIFLCGECTGTDPVRGMADALAVARAIEAMLQSGDPSFAREQVNPALCSRYAPHDTWEPSVPVLPDGNCYTPEQAQAEAGRCMQCDCEACMDACELLIQYKKKPPRIAQDVAQDGQTRNSVSSASITRQTWSCSLCGRCGSLCREGVDLSGLFELSRRDRVGNKLYPPALHAYRMREYALSTGDAGLVISGQTGTHCSRVFFPGCRLGAANPDYVTETYALLRQGVPDTGLILNCCGIPALWAGEGEAFDRQISFLRQTWEELGRPILVYACASCRKTFTRFLPEIPLQSVYDLLPVSTSSGLPPRALFDPCAAAGADDLKQSVRGLAQKAGQQLTDYDSGGKCCGFGGHMQLANPGLYDTITANRCRETEDPFLVYCVNCAEVFRKNGKDCRHILDLVLNKIPAGLPSLDEKRKNQLETRRRLEERWLGTASVLPSVPADSLTLFIEPEAMQAMERKLIPAGDVREAILLCEEAGDGFENEAGEILCRMAGPILTCWVRYRPEADGYRVLEVYNHRMHIREEEEVLP